MKDSRRRTTEIKDPHLCFPERKKMTSSSSSSASYERKVRKGKGYINVEHSRRARTRTDSDASTKECCCSCLSGGDYCCGGPDHTCSCRNDPGLAQTFGWEASFLVTLTCAAAHVAFYFGQSVSGPPCGQFSYRVRFNSSHTSLPLLQTIPTSIQFHSMRNLLGGKGLRICTTFRLMATCAT